MGRGIINLPLSKVVLIKEDLERNVLHIVLEDDSLPQWDEGDLPHMIWPAYLFREGIETLLETFVL